VGALHARFHDGGGPEGRDRIYAEQEFKEALREAAANMLRVIRGAGKSYALLKQMSDVVAAAVKVRDVTGQLPTDILETVLHGESETEAIWEKRRTGEIDEASIDRWHEDGTIDRKYAENSIKAGVLQIIASQFVEQTLQERAGESEMNDGINKAIAARHKSNKYWEAKYPPAAKRVAKNKSHLRDGSGRCWVKMMPNYRLCVQRSGRFFWATTLTQKLMAMADR
jgi:hypothetical protein